MAGSGFDDQGLAARDARQFRAAARTLVTAALLSLSACATAVSREDDQPSAREQDEPPVLNVCRDDDTRTPLAPGMKLTQAFDYVADVSAGEVLSERGERCGTAQHLDPCLGASESAPSGDRFLLTIQGDSVHFWPQPLAASVLGRIDRAQEAVWLAEARNYMISCLAQVVAERDDYLITAAGRVVDDASCNRFVMGMQLRVTPDGEITEHDVSTFKTTGCGAPVAVELKARSRP